MARIGKSLIIFILPFFISLQSWAAVTVQSYVDRNQVGLGDTFTVTVSVNSGDSVEVSEPRVPQIDGFDLVNSWTSSSTSSKLVQGQHGMEFQTVHRQDFNYMLTPKKVGNLSVPAFEVIVDGKTNYTKPIVIKVGKKSTAPKNQQPQEPEDEMDEAEQLFQQLLQRHGMMGGGTVPQGRGGGGSQGPSHFKNLPTNPNEALSVKLEVDKTEVYEGEQILASWYIYTRGQILSLDRVKFPDLKGFWKEIIEEVPSLNFTQEIINGVPYRRALLASHALFPIKAGTAVIDPYTIKASVAMPANPYSSFGFGQAYTYNRSSDRVVIKVKPLPTEGKPQDFSGAVGQFDVHASVEGQKFPVNQPFTFKVRFEGSGNAKLIELPALNLPAGVEVYDTKNDAKYFKNGKSYKEFDVLLIPRQEGEIKIPSLSFSMFDPQQKKYVTKRTEPITVTIVPNPNGNNQNSGEKFIDAKKQSEPAAYKPTPVVAYSDVSLYEQYFKLIWSLVFAFIALFLAWRARKDLLVRSKKVKLKEQIQARLKKIKVMQQNNEWRKVGTEMINLYYLVLGQLSGQKGAVNEIHKLLEVAPPSVRREIGKDLAKWIEYFQTISFAPEEIVGRLKENSEMAKAMDESEKLFAKAIELTESLE